MWKWLSILVALLLGACDRRPMASTASVVSVTLDGAWNDKPWEPRVLVRRPESSIRLTTKVEVPESLAGQSTTLVLEGLWWTARVSVDGQSLGTLVGGRPPARLWIPDGLRAGTHTLTLDIARPKGISRFAHGGGIGAGIPPEMPTLHRPPVLEFGTKVPVEMAGVRLEPSGAVALVSFASETLPPNATVRLFTALDGRVQTDFGTHTVQPDGTVRSPPTPLKQPLWEWGDSALTHLMVEVRDSAGAEVMTWATRTGLRRTDMTAEGLRINETQGTVAAIRVAQGHGYPDFLSTFSLAVDGGVNAVEMHGGLVHSQQLDIADELGIPIIHLPRCVGRIGRPPANGQALVETLRQQDEALIRGVGAHPSVVSWLVEGDRQRLGPGRVETGDLPSWTDAITSDPMRRPVVGVKLPGTILRIKDLRTAAMECPAGCGGKWIVESTFRVVPVPGMWQKVADAWKGAFDAKIPGGTLPTPMEAEAAIWAEAFAPMLDKAGVEPFALDRTRRASSRVQVEGAKAGELVWVEAPGMVPKGGQAGTDGVVHVDVWYEGEATVRGAGWEQTVDLRPMSWKGPKIYGYPTEVRLPTAE